VLPAVPFPLLVLGTLLLVSLVAAVVVVLSPFVLIPVFWVLAARGGWGARGARRHCWHQDRWR
jgi:hypothetical protein